ncbi:hypothetical protein MesoLjLc_58980 [Mesorhizobium sp. L-8-10]|uniref:hypothetical protein n=1 Tax=Mesorhizobium sp. L-8-10 TaxID=2744523 RepID=UPI001927EC94|nr:hypothetical protein [Mesorhizobium sp. L-8-10]BCH33968.1 hypothetical protein MesoLjLc_58980 [Mesorhizobium sp. L-8-10]
MATRFPWEVEQSDPFTAANPFSSAVQRDPWQGLRAVTGGSTGQRPNAPVGPVSGGASSRYNRLLDPNRGMMRGLGQLLGSPTREEHQREQFSSATAGAARAIQDRILRGGMSPQKAILDFLGTPEGQQFFLSGGDFPDLANIAALAAPEDRKAQLELEKTQLEVDRLRNPTTDDIDEYNLAKKEGYQGNFANWLAETSKPLVDMSQHEDPEKFIRQTLDTQTGEQFGKLREQGYKAAGLAQDFELLSELMKLAPQGNLTGLKLDLPFMERFSLAEIGNDAAGAFEATINRIVPTLRQPGSGAQSDKDMDVLRSSMPRLLNTPGANQLILQSLQAKAALDLERARVVDDYADRLITIAEARRKLREIDAVSIISPDMHRILESNTTTQRAQAENEPSAGTVDKMLRGMDAVPLGPYGAAAIPPDFMPDDPQRGYFWNFLTPEEKRLWQQ